jgi:hypothetical protein
MPESSRLLSWRPVFCLRVRVCMFYVFFFSTRKNNKRTIYWRNTHEFGVLARLYRPTTRDESPECGYVRFAAFCLCVSIAGGWSTSAYPLPIIFHLAVVLLCAVRSSFFHTSIARHLGTLPFQPKPSENRGRRFSVYVFTTRTPDVLRTTGHQRDDVDTL